MEKTLLENAYDPQQFREAGCRLVHLLSDHLSAAQEGRGGVLKYREPHEALAFWENYLRQGAGDTFIGAVLERITRVHHPKYMGHQVAPPLPLASLMALLGGTLNNGMAVYEMGMAPTAMERIVTDWLCRKVGYSERARGFLTSGGTLANLTALLSARRNRARKDIWNEGYTGGLAIMVSEAAHYCVDRAARIMGLGVDGVLKVPVRDDFSMDTSLLPQMYREATSRGLEVFAVVGSAPCTATGTHDDLQAQAGFCREHNLWFHVDGAHGGAAVCSEKYRALLTGIERADSIAIDGHKMMGMPVLTTALLFREGADSYTTFSQEAEYLLTETPEEDWYNGAKRTFECTKLTSALSWYAVLHQYGEGIFGAYLDRQYDLAREFAVMLRGREGWELFTEPQSNILCFRWAPVGVPEEALDDLNARMRQRVLEQGEFYIVQTRLQGRYYLRTTLMNPFTEPKDLGDLLEHLEALGHHCLQEAAL
jgi:L-2,4-diaminobutyrate decarboxylase